MSTKKELFDMLKDVPDEAEIIVTMIPSYNISAKLPEPPVEDKVAE